jgi:PAS domain S-box-containing protein
MLKSLSVTNDNLKGADQSAPAAEPQVDLLTHGAMHLLRQLPGFLCVLSGPEGEIAFTNAGFQQLTDCCTLGKPFNDTPMAAWPGLAGAVRKAFATGEASDLLRIALPEMYREIVIDVTVQPIRSGEGRLAAVAIQGTDVTGQVRSEAAMRAVHERAESILDVLGDGFVAFDKDFRVIKINAAALKYDGRQEHEILGKTHWEAWPSSAGSILEDVYQRCLAEQVQISIERRYLGFGRDRWLELRLCPVPGGIVCFYRDVTDRKVFEAALTAGEERFRALVEAVPHLVWEAGPKGEIEWINGRFAEYTGLAAEDLHNEAWREVLHPDDYDSIAAAWRLAQQDGSIFEREVRLRRRADDCFRWFLAKGVPVRDAEGEVIRWIGTNTEIHEEKAAAAELAQRNFRLEERVEESTRDRERMWRLSTDLMLVTGLDGTILATNPAWQLVLDWTDADLQGISVVDLVHPDSQASAQAQIANILIAPGGDGDKGQFEIRHRDGTYRWIAWKAVADEQFIHAVGRDITAEKTASDALQKTEEALRQSQKMEAVGQLTGGIAHDFNNLLTGVIGSLDLLGTRISQGRVGEVGRYIESAMSSAHRAAALTHRLLAFSRRQPLDPRPVDANELVASMDELFRRTISEAIRVDVMPKDDLWLTLCDPNQLESALLNLIINARDSMTGGGRIVITCDNATSDEPALSAQRDLAPGQYVMLSVTDNGSGMPKKVLERVFEPFFTTKPIGQGTGLGLSMVYGFVKQSGGHVTIASEPGAGTTVKIYLPRYHGDAARNQGTQPPAAKPRAKSKEVVLVVEDEPVVRSLVIDMLVELGYCALEAEDGAAALAILFADQPIDLLLTDVGLPGMNGRQLADAARERRPDLKVLFMTGYVENKILLNGFLGPHMEVIAKPFAGDALATKVERMIHG